MMVISCPVSCCRYQSCSLMSFLQVVSHSLCVAAVTYRTCFSGQQRCWRLAFAQCRCFWYKLWPMLYMCPPPSHFAVSYCCPMLLCLIFCLSLWGTVLVYACCHSAPNRTVQPAGCHKFSTCPLLLMLKLQQCLMCRYVFDGKPPTLKKEELSRRYTSES